MFGKGNPRALIRGKSFADLSNRVDDMQLLIGSPITAPITEAVPVCVEGTFPVDVLARGPLQ